MILVTALSLDGEKMWQRELGLYKGLHGSSNSPTSPRHRLMN